MHKKDGLFLAIREATPPVIAPETGEPHTRHVVHAIGYAGKITLRADFNACGEFDWFELQNWPAEQSARLIAFYDRYFTRTRPAHSPLWNGHSFVAGVIGVNVQWSPNRTPTDLELGAKLEAEDLHDNTPYVVAKNGIVSQSMLHLSAGNTLSVPGRGRALQVMPVEAVQALYGETVCEYAGLMSNPHALRELQRPDWGMYDLINPQLS